MKVVAFNGSPRKNGNTACSMNIVLAELENAGIETEMIHVGRKKIQGCQSCFACMKNHTDRAYSICTNYNLWEISGQYE